MRRYDGLTILNRYEVVETVEIILPGIPISILYIFIYYMISLWLLGWDRLNRLDRGL